MTKVARKNKKESKMNKYLMKLQEKKLCTTANNLTVPKTIITIKKANKIKQETKIETLIVLKRYSLQAVTTQKLESSKGTSLS